MQTEVVVIGGGIAGVSAAHAIAARIGGDRVALVEAEPQLAHHTTGRSAAQLVENYGAEANRPLTTASLAFLRDPPPDLVDAPLLRPRAQLTIATPEQDTAIDRMLTSGRESGVELQELTRHEAVELAPFLRPEVVHRAIVEPDSADIDVAGLHQAFVRGFRSAGGQIRTSTRVDSATAQNGRWRVDTTHGPLTAVTIVNAAGAWGDLVAQRAGVTPVGLQPLRRTAFMVNSPFAGSDQWPLTADAEHNWYTKPDGTQFLCSLADETPSEPCDARPEEADVALAIERINAATTLGIRSVNSSWAGLRTFAPDRAMVIGPDPANAAFVWLAGQGGTGIQSAVGAGRLVADLVTDGEPDPALGEVDLAALTPARFGDQQK